MFNISVLSGMSDPFLSSSSVRAIDDDPQHFACKASVIGLPPGHFPGMMETDLGNGDTLYIDGSIFDGSGNNFVGLAYRQSGGCRVSVFVDLRVVNTRSASSIDDGAADAVERRAQMRRSSWPRSRAPSHLVADLP
jgi:hypothetical protein